MNALLTGGGIAAILGVIYYMTRQAKATEVVAELVVKPKAEEIKEVQEIAAVTQEIKDAKITYQTAREHYNQRLADATSSAEVPSHSGPSEGMPGTPESGR